LQQDSINDASEAAELQIQNDEVVPETVSSELNEVSLPAPDCSEATSQTPTSDKTQQDSQTTRVWSLSDIKHQWRKFNIDLMPKVLDF
jgi:hypothetical protein